MAPKRRSRRHTATRAPEPALAGSAYEKATQLIAHLVAAQVWLLHGRPENRSAAMPARRMVEM
jgi:hypothetical protein